MAGSNVRSGKSDRKLKHLHRFEDRGMLGGVCAGIAYRFAIPTWIVRLVFFLAFWLYSTGLLVYLALWFLVPDAPALPKDYIDRTGDHD